MRQLFLHVVPALNPSAESQDPCTLLTPLATVTAYNYLFGQICKTVSRSQDHRRTPVVNVASWVRVQRLTSSKVRIVGDACPVYPRRLCSTACAGPALLGLKPVLGVKPLAPLGSWAIWAVEMHCHIQGHYCELQCCMTFLPSNDAPIMQIEFFCARRHSAAADAPWPQLRLQASCPNMSYTHLPLSSSCARLERFCFRYIYS